MLVKLFLKSKNSQSKKKEVVQSQDDSFVIQESMLGMKYEYITYNIMFSCVQ